MTRTFPATPACPLARLHTTRPDAQTVARDGYHKTGVIVLFPDQLNDDFERRLVEGIADRLYGPRPRPAGPSGNRRRTGR